MRALWLIVLIGCSKPDEKPDRIQQPEPPAVAPQIDAMTDPNTPITQAPPTPKGTAPEDTARYVKWMEGRGKTVKKAREDVSLRIGDWGFFDQGAPAFGDRAALDKAGHAVLPSEK